jgi:CRP/FNR family transcriptional regulator, nitrogen oxide reductase regulator
MKISRLNTDKGLDARTTMSRRVAVVQQFPFFAGMSKTDCEDIVSSALEKIFSPRQTIFAAGEPVRQIFLLTSGSLKLTQVGRKGSAVILGITGPGELLGACSCFLGDNHHETAHALQSSKVLVWEREIFESVWERFPTLWRNAEQILSERLQELEERFREVSSNKIAVRLSSELVRLLNQVGRAVNGEVEIYLSQAELAQLTGMTVFTASRLISQWEQRGILEAKRGALLIHNVPALIRLSEEN